MLLITLIPNIEVLGVIRDSVIVRKKNDVR